MSFLQSFINSTLNENQVKFKKILDSDNKSELKNHIFNKNDNNLNDKCPITMKTFDDGEHITCLPCGHLFDSDSIEEWVLNEQATCPVCRFEMKHTKEIRITPRQSTQQTTQTTETTETTNNHENNISSINTIISLSDYYNMILDTDDISENDPMINNIRNYLSLIDRIIHREIEQEENNIMQEAILASIIDE